MHRASHSPPHLYCSSICPEGIAGFGVLWDSGCSQRSDLLKPPQFFVQFLICLRRWCVGSSRHPPAITSIIFLLKVTQRFSIVGALRPSVAGCCIFNVFFFLFTAAESLIWPPMALGSAWPCPPTRAQRPWNIQAWELLGGLLFPTAMFKVNNTPAVTPSRDRIASMRLAAGKLRSEIQFVCVCMVLWCFCLMCKICNSLLKPVCCLKRAEFQLQLQISLKGRAFMFQSSDRAAHYSLLVAFIAHKKKTHFPIPKSGTAASSYLAFLLSVCRYQSLTSLWSLCFFVFFVVEGVFVC